VLHKDSAQHSYSNVRCPSVYTSRFLRSCVSIPLIFLSSTISPCRSFFHRPILLFSVGFNHLFIRQVHFLPFVFNTHTNSNPFYPHFPTHLYFFTILENCAIVLTIGFQPLHYTTKYFMQTIK